jgi:diguanylate cyclase (GGDEF)-like protein
MVDRQSFVEELEYEIERARRGRRRLSVLVGQLGTHGQYDFAGRPADDLVDRTGAVLEEQKRQVDVVASLGQGRFGLILPETGEPGALAVAERLQSAVANALGTHAPRLSFGVAALGRHGRKASALLRAAQRAAAAEELVLIDRPVAAC